MLRTTMRALLIGGLAVLALAGSAQARQVQQYFYAGEFFSAGSSNPAAIAVDGVDQKLLAVGNGDKEHGLKISQFQLNGDPAGFSGRGGATSFNTGEKLSLTPTVSIAVDESGTVSNGNFYITSLESSLATPLAEVYGYAADGTSLPGFPISVPSACGITVAHDGHLWVAGKKLGAYGEFSANGSFTGRVLFPGDKGGCRIAIDSVGNFYVGKGERLAKYDSSLHFLGDLSSGDSNSFSGRGTPLIALDRNDDTLFELSAPRGSSEDILTQVDSEGSPITTFGGPDPAHFSYGGLGNSALDLAVDPQTHKVYVLKGAEVNVFSRDPSTVTVPTTHANGVENLSGTGATLTGTVDPDGANTSDCHFEWGTAVEGDVDYSETAPCDGGGVIAGESGATPVTAAVSGLEKGTVYHFRLSSANANGIPSVSSDREFSAADPPILGETSVSHITTDSARIRFEINTEGVDSSYHVEIGTDTSYGVSLPVPDATVLGTRIGSNFEGVEVVLTRQRESQEVGGLKPETLYHYRVVAENPAGVIESADHTFRTFALPSSGEDKCPNAQARQQTSAAGLLDCRAYELVSAAETGGYDVRSDLSPGVSALATPPQAPDAALYSMRSGTIPGIVGHPTNRGADPYLATRDPDGWSTRYIGLPSDNPFATGPFASPLSGSDSSLRSFAFGGSEICGPCFEDGSTNAPLRLSDGSLIKGMAGSMEPGPAEPAGTVIKPLSADGSHFVFGTTSQFEPEGNSNGTDATLYERYLNAGSTEVISTDATGTAIANAKGVAELDITKDGSRTVVGEKVSSDADGNAYYHLYLHFAGRAQSVDLTPGTSTGVLYDGMSADGSMVFFTASDALTGEDTDASADIYEDEVPGPGTVISKLISGGSEGTGNTDACSPPGIPSSWNAVSGNGKCNVLALAGGAGAGADGSFYFLSPELLDGPSAGTQDQANLYRVAPGSTTPHFVATIDSSVGKTPPAPPTRPVVSTEFGGGHSGPQAMTVDQSNGDVYVIEPGEARVSRYTADGAPDNFTDPEAPGVGTNQITGLVPNEFENFAGVAVDNSGGSFNHDIYATTATSVRLFSSTGKPLGELNGSGTSSGFFEEACGVAVDQSDGNLYVADHSGYVWRYAPTSVAQPISDSDYTVTGIETASTGVFPCAVAADDGNIYAAKKPNGPVKQFSATAFESTPPSVSGVQINAKARALSTDPVTHEVYVADLKRIVTFNPAGEQQLTIGAGELGEFSVLRGVAVNASTHHVYVSNLFEGNITEFGYHLTPYEPIDNPAIVHAVKQAGTYDSADLQITPNGRYAAFASSRSIDGYANANHYEIFRYDAEAGGIPHCVSCSITTAPPESNATLTPYGSSLLEDGRVFFDTGEQLTLRDTNEKQDAYQWENGNQQLISTGTSPSDSELLSVSSDGKNAFFFTRQKLVPEDNNGSNVRLYTAREDGGFEFGPPQFQCAASDECHGASTTPAPPLAAGTMAGTPGQFKKEKSSKCAKGKVKRRGKCVSRHTHKRHNHKRAAKTTRGGGK